MREHSRSSGGEAAKIPPRRRPFKKRSNRKGNRFNQPKKILINPLYLNPNAPPRDMAGFPLQPQHDHVPLPWEHPLQPSPFNPGPMQHQDRYPGNAQMGPGHPFHQGGNEGAMNMRPEPMPGPPPFPHQPQHMPYQPEMGYQGGQQENAMMHHEPASHHYQNPFDYQNEPPFHYRQEPEMPRFNSNMPPPNIHFQGQQHQMPPPVVNVRSVGAFDYLQHAPDVSQHFNPSPMQHHHMQTMHAPMMNAQCEPEMPSYNGSQMRPQTMYPNEHPPPFYNQLEPRDDGFYNPPKPGPYENQMSPKFQHPWGENLHRQEMHRPHMQPEDHTPLQHAQRMCHSDTNWHARQQMERHFSDPPLHRQVQNQQFERNDHQAQEFWERPAYPSVSSTEHQGAIEQNIQPMFTAPRFHSPESIIRRNKPKIYDPKPLKFARTTPSSHDTTETPRSHAGQPSFVEPQRAFNSQGSSKPQYSSKPREPKIGTIDADPPLVNAEEAEYQRKIQQQKLEREKYLKQKERRRREKAKIVTDADLIEGTQAAAVVKSTVPQSTDAQMKTDSLQTASSASANNTEQITSEQFKHTTSTDSVTGNEVTFAREPITAKSGSAGASSSLVIPKQPMIVKSLTQCKPNVEAENNKSQVVTPPQTTPGDSPTKSTQLVQPMRQVVSPRRRIVLSRGQSTKQLQCDQTAVKQEVGHPPSQVLNQSQGTQPVKQKAQSTGSGSQQLLLGTNKQEASQQQNWVINKDHLPGILQKSPPVTQVRSTQLITNRNTNPATEGSSLHPGAKSPIRTVLDASKQQMPMGKKLNDFRLCGRGRGGHSLERQCQQSLEDPPQKANNGKPMGLNYTRTNFQTGKHAMLETHQRPTGQASIITANNESFEQLHRPADHNKTKRFVTQSRVVVQKGTQGNPPLNQREGRRYVEFIGSDDMIANNPCTSSNASQSARPGTGKAMPSVWRDTPEFNDNPFKTSEASILQHTAEKTASHTNHDVWEPTSVFVSRSPFEIQREFSVSHASAKYRRQNLQLANNLEEARSQNAPQVWEHQNLRAWNAQQAAGTQNLEHAIERERPAAQPNTQIWINPHFIPKTREQNLPVPWALEPSGPQTEPDRWASPPARSSCLFEGRRPRNVQLAGQAESEWGSLSLPRSALQQRATETCNNWPSQHQTEWERTIQEREVMEANFPKPSNRRVINRRPQGVLAKPETLTSQGMQPTNAMDLHTVFQDQHEGQPQRVIRRNPNEGNLGFTSEHAAPSTSAMQGTTSYNAQGGTIHINRQMITKASHQPGIPTPVIINNLSEKNTLSDLRKMCHGFGVINILPGDSPTGAKIIFPSPEDAACFKASYDRKMINLGLPTL